jgi:uncharacterized Rossmann fold enzyme
MDIEILCNTADELLFENVRANSSKPLEWVKQCEAHDGHAVIVGGGPSAADCIESIRWRFGLGQTIFALNNAAKMLMQHRITPEFQVIVDAREHNVAFVGNSNNQLLASQCHPSAVEKALNPILWHPVIEGIVDVIDSEREYALIGGGTTVGLSAMCLAYTLGYRKIHLYGYDSSHRGKASHAYAQPENDREPIVKVTAYGKTWDCSLAMASQAELFPECANRLIDLGCIITMDGDGLLPTAFRQLWPDRSPAVYTPTAIMSEPEKYEAIWDKPEYRNVSPGEACVEPFLMLAGPGTVIDFGCGTGRAGQRLSEAGHKVTLYDFAPNCLDEGVRARLTGNLSLVQGSLFDPIKIRADYGFCTDVMEHIPPESVDAVLQNIMGAVEKAFFQISLVPDNMGSLIGQQLHLSVHPMSWWRETFQRLGYRIEWEQNRDHIAALFFVSLKPL